MDQIQKDFDNLILEEMILFDFLNFTNLTENIQVIQQMIMNLPKIFSPEEELSNK
jgi:hypothetical protein